MEAPNKTMNALLGSLLVFFTLLFAVGAKDVVGPEQKNAIFIGGVYDTEVYYWAHDIFQVTVDVINEEWNEKDPDHPRLVYALEHSGCDSTTAARSYWKIRTENGGIPPDGLVGARCSGASATLARISGLEGVPHISPTSNSDKLSNTEEFPYFSRIVAPNDERGEGRW